MQGLKKIVSLTIISYPAWAIPFAFLSMALFRLPLLLSRNIEFWRLMGSGRNGTFDIVPDLRQWAILAVYDNRNADNLLRPSNKTTVLKQLYGPFINRWIQLFSKECTTCLLEPLEGHGLWNGREVFGKMPKNSLYDGEIAVLTRATIRLTKLARFWKHVPEAALEMANAEGFINSYGLGEWPWVKQATFSQWKSKEHMRMFAYKSKYHKEIIRKTHEENWYSEEMFVRFRVLSKI